MWAGFRSERRKAGTRTIDHTPNNRTQRRRATEPRVQTGRAPHQRSKPPKTSISNPTLPVCQTPAMGTDPNIAAQWRAAGDATLANRHPSARPLQQRS